MRSLNEKVEKLKCSLPINFFVLIFHSDLLQAIQSTYLCTPYRGSSLDLIQAVARQFTFAFKATKVINWDAPQGIVNGIRNYGSFLAIIKENKNLTAVPTLEIGLYI
jgi:uncharacterized membrane protein (DUF485 family)